MQKYIDLKNSNDYTKLKKPAEIIKNGGIVVFPTETVYGIGTNVFNDKSVRKIYDIKQRNINKPISLLVSNMDMVKQVAKDISKLEYALMETFFPGPITIILKKKNCVSDIVTAKQSTVGIRMPSGIIARKLIEYANVPLATPSANISGKPSGIDIKNIIKDFEGKVDCFIDGGISEIGLASTIVQVIDEVPYILRQGAITEEQIRKVIV